MMPDRVFSYRPEVDGLSSAVYVRPNKALPVANGFFAMSPNIQILVAI